MSQPAKLLSQPAKLLMSPNAKLLSQTAKLLSQPTVPAVPNCYPKISETDRADVSGRKLMFRSKPLSQATLVATSETEHCTTTTLLPGEYDLHHLEQDLGYSIVNQKKLTLLLIWHFNRSLFAIYFV